jgi:hypothetical protein
MKGVTGRQLRKLEVGVRFPAEALAVPPAPLGNVSRSRSEQVGIRPDSATTKSTVELLRKAVGDALEAIPARKHGLRPHGTTSRYKQGCKCDECRAAHAAARREQSRRNPKPQARRLAEYRDWHDAKPLYAIWRGMKIRCLSPKHHEFHRYGGRGIKIHQPWIDSYDQFEADVTAEIGPRVGLLTIDRVNNNGNYEPGNIRWLPRVEQAKNKTHARGEGQGNSVLAEASVYAIRRIAALELFPKSQIAKWFGVGPSTIGNILARHTWRHIP